MSHRCFSLLGAAFLAATVGSSAMAGGGIADALQNVQDEHPNAGFYFANDGRVTRMYGQHFTTGDTPVDSANRFITRYPLVFGQNRGTFVPMTGQVETMMTDRNTGVAKFHLMQYEQKVNGIPVFRSALKLLMLNQQDNPVVLASANVRDLAGLNIVEEGDNARRGMGMIQPKDSVTSAMKRNARRLMGGDGEVTGENRLVIWAGVEDMIVEPRLAVEFILETELRGDNYQKVLFLADAETDEILFQEDQVLNCFHGGNDITGNVSGMATEGVGADICNDEFPTGLPYARVTANGQTVFADVNGDFTINNSGTGNVTVNSTIRGQYFRVFNESGADASLSLNVSPPGPADFLHNAANNSETNRAEVNAYLHSNIVRDFVLFHVPDYPVIGGQTEFPVNVNIGSSCNAFYNGSSINFYTSGSGCPNTAFSSVVYHEYGHHLVATGGSGQGAYGEGMSDVTNILIADDPRLGVGFFSNCNDSLRNADNNCQYDPNNCSSCGSAIHSCGNLISGCVWDTMENIRVTEGSNMINVVAPIAFNAVRLHTGSSITPEITIDYLTLNDDDGNLANGSPHYQEINDAFSAHNMPGPELALIALSFPNGRPEIIDPSGGTSVLVQVEAVAGVPQPGSGMLHIDTGSGFQAMPMNDLGNNMYEAIFPAVPCETEVKYYVSAESTSGQEATAPSNAPTGFFTTISAEGLDIALSDDFESNLGWSVQNVDLDDGAWQRGVPAGGGDRQDPASDFDGSGRCYLTANQDGNSDVDGGPTRLISPVLDLSNGSDYIVSYARWFGMSSNGARDEFVVEVTNNGSNWTQVEIVTVDSDVWIESGFRVSDFVSLNSTVQVRFSVSDNPNDTVTEAGLDAFEVIAINCDGGNGGLATINSIETNFGTELSGGVSDVTASDDSYYVSQSAFGFLSSEPNVAEVRVSSTSPVEPASQIDVTVEARLNNPGGTMRLRMRDWTDSGSYTDVATYGMFNSDTTENTTVNNAARFVQSGTARLDLAMRQTVVATFSLSGFQSRIDLVEMNVQ